MLFVDDVTVVLSPAEWAICARPIVGDGGAQLLLRDLLAAMIDEHQILATYVQLDRAYQYAYSYGGGGFQDRFRAIIKAALRAGWAPK